MARRALILVALVLLVRLPFLNQAIQGDDVYYLAGAQHAQIDPLHPTHARYVFLGDEVDMRGHPHPPLNAWFLAALLALFRDIREVPFHAAYLLFSIAAALAALSLAHRFAPDRALAAAALFVVTPAFVVNGNSLESDLPFVALWLTSAALFVWGRLVLAAGAMALTALAAYQSVVLVPILWLYIWQRKRNWLVGYAVAATPIFVLLAWQLLERLSTGDLPATVLAGHFRTYNLQSLTAKLANAGALTAHLGWIVFPLLAVLAFRRAWFFGVAAAIGAAFVDPHPLYWLSAGVGGMILLWCAHCWREYEAQWLLVFFAAALVLFFAGSARYLLPLVLPVALLTVKLAPPRFLWPGVAAQAAFSLSLAFVNYQHWDGYRQFVHSLTKEIGETRTWINGEWGLRYYAEEQGGLAVRRAQPLRAGDLVLASRLAYPVPLTTGGGQLVPYAVREIRPALPLRLIGLGARSGYSTAANGLRPFDVTGAPADIVQAFRVMERRPSLEYLPMNAPDAASQIVSGIFELEQNRWRWMGARGALMVKPPAQPRPVQVELFLPDQAPGRRVSIALDGITLLETDLPGPGAHTLKTPPALGQTLTIGIDKTFSVPGDQRKLGLILVAAGFRY
ncbi:MAG: hypothetical protein SFV54_22435 [Bryobacteraceae bacterium]|nr:hypothetical protein [Bryobacteraceae bacterium]